MGMLLWQPFGIPFKQSFSDITIEAGSGLVDANGLEEGKLWVTTKQVWGFFRGDASILDLDSGMVAQHCKYTLKKKQTYFSWLKWKILCYVNFIPQN